MGSVGRVHLVGAGPGDPDLLTVKALRLLGEADVVVYDRLVSDEILALVPEGVSRIFVGKAAGNHVLPQDEINRIIVKLALAGHDVVRLKGGDPFIFGRGGEEALELAEHGIPFEVVPGITAAVACAAYAGIPVTHRGLASGVQLVAGHCRGKTPLELNWHSLADRELTLVFYMGLANLFDIRAGLTAAGREGATPVAVVAEGTKAGQRRLLTTLDRAPDDVAAAGIAPPAVVIIGDVVALSAKLDWFAADRRAETTMARAGHG
ncbi:MAG TPA: uroporphyrinogen-III C-methyltransferase [Gammaproteobacteria bacterium]|nr:uroporphyrinogen-III C-methyltransferase [Gammaproteobacteria bacterium]